MVDWDKSYFHNNRWWWQMIERRGQSVYIAEKEVVATALERGPCESFSFIYFTRFCFYAVILLFLIQILCTFSIDHAKRKRPGNQRWRLGAGGVSWGGDDGTEGGGWGKDVEWQFERRSWHICRGDDLLEAEAAGAIWCRLMASLLIRV